MRRFTAGLAGLLFVGFAFAADPPDVRKKIEPIPRAEQLKRLIVGSADAQKVFLKTYRESTDKEGKAKALESYRAAPKKVAPAILAIAKAKPEDETGLDAAIWLVQFAGDSPEAKGALDILSRHHLANAKMADVVIRMVYVPNSETFLKDVMKENPDRKVKAAALRSLAGIATNEAVSYLTAEKDIAGKSKEAVKLWEQAQKEFGDVEVFRTTKLGDLAKDEIFAIQNLFPGSKPLEIDGKDTDGKPMKLSDFKGKVIMLDFWGTWCGPCMQMVPHNVKVVKQFEGKPFVLVGVNSDRDKEMLAKRVEEHKINYRSFSNGEEGPGGPISKEWKVQGWPTIVLIDHKGTIRRRFLGSPDTDAEWKGLDDALEMLIKEAEGK